MGSRKRSIESRWLVVVASLVMGPSLVLAPAPARGASARVLAPGAQDYDGLMGQGDQQRAASEHAAAARSYTAAYDMLSAEDRVGLYGELALDNALADYRAAYEQAPEDVATLEEPIALLERAIDQHEAAMASGQAEAVPERLVEELARLRVQLGEIRAREAASADASDDEAPTLEEPEPSMEPETPVEPNAKRPPARTADIAILASGVAAVVAGTGLIAGGGWNFSQIDERRETRLAALESGEFSDEASAQYRADLEAWESQWRGRATGLVVGGSVLAAAGIGLTAWGAIRMRRHGQSGARASIAVPIVSRERVGLSVRVAF